jgi:hypothetical protein
MGQVRLLDEAMNTSGYLRLCTENWYVQHLGNVVSKDASTKGGRAKKRTKMSGFWRWAPIRALLQRIYGWSFDRLHRG